MDVGCYGVSAMRLLCGEPERVSGEQVLFHGVDARFAGVLRFGGDVLGLLDCGMDVHRRNSLEVVGDAGTIVVPSPWQTPFGALIVVTRDGEPEEIRPETVDPYGRELEAMVRAITAGEPPPLGRADALGQARTIQALYRAAATGAAVTL
jgi:predicted dehydrogenase